MQALTWSTSLSLLCVFCAVVSTGNCTRVLDVFFAPSDCMQDIYHNDFIKNMTSARLFADTESQWQVRVSQGDDQLPPVDALLSYLLSTHDQKRDFLAVIYPGCSQDVEYIAEICDNSLFSSALLTYAFSDLDTVHLTRPNHIRLIPNELHLATGAAAIINEYHWKRVVVITQQLPVFKAISKEANQVLNITITNIKLEEENREFIFPKDNRIFLLNMYPSQALPILCQAYHQNMLFPDYVWIMYGWYTHDWWMESTQNCTPAEVATVLEGSIAISHLNQLNSSHSHVYSALVSDVVLTVLSAVQSNASNLTEVIRNTTVNGETGLISFNGAGSSRVLEQIRVLQYNQTTDASLLELVEIGHVPVDSGLFQYSSGVDTEDVWAGEVPSDGTPVTVMNYPLLALMVICYTAATAGILFAAVCFIFNIVFRKKKLIRLTSPTINHIIILGTVVFYSSVYTFFYPPSTHSDMIAVICNFRVWLTSVGFSLCYVPINVKMWRVYHISRKPSLKKSLIQDWHLMLCILLFLVVDLIILTIVTSIDGSRYTTTVIPDKEHPGNFTNEAGFTSSYTVTRCYSATELYWLPVVFGYKFLLQAIGVYLAFSIRKVKIRGLNDSREVSVILYTTSVILIIVLLVTFIFGDYINVDGGVYGIGISIATTAVLAFLFIPKMYGLYKDPNGENIFITTKSGTLKSQLASAGNKPLSLTSPVKAVSPWNGIEVAENQFTDLNTSKETEKDSMEGTESPPK